MKSDALIANNKLGIEILYFDYRNAFVLFNSTEKMVAQQII